MRCDILMTTGRHSIQDPAMMVLYLILDIVSHKHRDTLRYSTSHRLGGDSILAMSFSQGTRDSLKGRGAKSSSDRSLSSAPTTRGLFVRCSRCHDDQLVYLSSRESIRNARPNRLKIWTATGIVSLVQDIALSSSSKVPPSRRSLPG